MRHARTAVLFFCLIVLTPGSAAAATDDNWTDAVTAMEEVVPALQAPPLVSTDVKVVGGGKANPGPSFPNFAFSAFRRNGATQGQMKLIAGFGQTFSANVVCISTTYFPGGGGIARLVGELTEPVFSAPTMIFDVTDSGLHGGEGDAWSGFFSPLAPLDFPCDPGGGGAPIAEGSIAVRPFD
jgi:hypothetical protein